MNNNEKMFDLLKELSNKAEWDTLPKNLLKEIGFSSYNSGVNVSIIFDETFIFSFELCFGYERSDFKTLTFEEVISLLKEA